MGYEKSSLSYKDQYPTREALFLQLKCKRLPSGKWQCFKLLQILHKINAFVHADHAGHFKLHLLYDHHLHFARRCTFLSCLTLWSVSTTVDFLENLARGILSNENSIEVSRHTWTVISAILRFYRHTPVIYHKENEMNIECEVYLNNTEADSDSSLDFLVAPCNH